MKKQTITHYIPLMVNPRTWQKLRVYIRYRLLCRIYKPAGERLTIWESYNLPQKYQLRYAGSWYPRDWTSDSGVDHEDMGKKVLRGEAVPLPSPRRYGTNRQLWLSPRGYVVLAGRENPDRYDQLELARRMQRWHAPGPNPGPLECALADLSACIEGIAFCRHYGIPVEERGTEVEDALSTMNPRYRGIIQMRLGPPGCKPTKYKLVGAAHGVSSARAQQLYGRALYALRSRIRWNRTQKRFQRYSAR
jgi:hypothetical protein